MGDQRVYIAIDLKSFYASVECVARGLDPLTTNLVVADESRTDRTICLAVTPSLKALGVPGRPRLFEVKQILETRRKITGKVTEFIIAPPRMRLYMDCSTKIYNVYLQFISAADIHVYSIDEVFMDVTGYLKMYNATARELAVRMVHKVLEETGITATVGIGTNLYLAKVAMDIVAKHAPADADGCRIAELDEMSYREQLWEHKPITAFWRVGPGIARRLESGGMYTMGDVARMSLQKNRFDPGSCHPDSRPCGNAISGEDYLYKLFGVDAELIIDHAWGREPCTMADIKAYRPSANSISVGQVLSHAYTKEKGLVVFREMVDSLVLDLVEKGLVTNQVGFYVGYDHAMRDPARGETLIPYNGPMCTDPYGKAVPKPAGGSIRLPDYTASTKELTEAAVALYEAGVHPALLVRRLNVVFGNVIREEKLDRETEQLDLFTDPREQEARREREKKERSLQKAMLQIKGKYGKNAILKGTNYQEGATGRERNGQVGGHKA